jgi:hypothetical protein
MYKYVRKTIQWGFVLMISIIAYCMPFQTYAQPEANSSLELYEDPALGISILFPNTWDVLEYVDGVGFGSGFDNASDRYVEAVDVVISPTNATSLQENVDILQAQLNNSLNDFVLTESNLTSLAGMEAQMLLYNYSDPIIGATRTLAFTTLNEGNSILITYSAKPSDFPSKLPIVKQMIDSFQIRTE